VEKLSSKLLSLFRDCDQTKRLVLNIDQDINSIVTGLAGSSGIFMLAGLHDIVARPLMCILPDENRAEQIYGDLSLVLDPDRVVFFPAHGQIAWSEIGPKGSVVGMRLNTLKALLLKNADVVVCSAPALTEKCAEPEVVKRRQITLKKGKTTSFADFIETLVLMGFEREFQVDRPGEMSVRGGVIDLFLYEEPHPYRLEFFGDTVESIREFDVESQRSIRHLDVLDIIPISSAGPYGPFDENPIDILPFTSTLIDYLHEDTLVSMFDQSMVHAEMDRFVDEIGVRIDTFAKEHSVENLSFYDYYCGDKVQKKQLSRYVSIDFPIFFDSSDVAIAFDIGENAHFAGKLPLFKQELARNESIQIITGIFCDSDSQKKQLNELLLQEDFPPYIEFEALNLSEGFQWPAEGVFIYTNRELYSRIRLPKPGRLERRAISMRYLSALNLGDFVVHTDYGIGIYRGLEHIKAYGQERECLKIEYQDKEMLYVPLEKMDRVQKYASRENAIPQLSKLGTVRWDKIKKRTKKRIKEIARQLIRLYAVRQMREGHAFPADTIWQKELEASFQYDETIDQMTAIEDIKRDMERPRPMDRLVCGDVGYGKTEVAIRAAFKAINDGRQVAVLVPTTILAQQHYNTFTERLAQFPVEIDMLSRFKSASHQKQIVAKLASGQLDLVIGTHRLLSKDVMFKDLGLLIIDEEQKFGVLHKEKLKLLRETVDTLTLSATPIPRTMHMALIGSKDMSIINTPPTNRMPIRTEVSRFDRDYVREILLREVDRGGQIFFVHNRVQSIYSVANMLSHLVPEISIAVAHGQMDTHQLERIMIEFVQGKVHCLVCTMIIESGIDMPNANTLVVNRADRFGLSQLYQLRGRVGRSDHQAYAVLLVPPIRRLTRTAIKRLQTIQEMTDFGSGYKIAMRDLEIRGAGNIFGAQQSGYVDALGYELYTKIIEEAIRELKQEMNISEPEDKKENEIDPQIEMSIDAYLPEDYVAAATERVNIYHRLIDAPDQEQIVELID
jgi:transcription-repair coupling factor (superfamily II helicase)